MKKSLALFLAMAVIIASCDEEHETGVEFLTADVGEMPSHASEFWVFATNEQGAILDVVQFRSGVTFSLRTSVEYSRIDLTFLTIFEQNGSKNLNLSTYKDFPAGETIVMGAINSETTPSTPIGSAVITITNYSEALNPLHNFRFAQYPSGPLPIPISSSGTTHTFGLGLQRSPTKMLVHGLKNKVPAYKMLANLSVDDNVVLDFQTFQPYENLVEIKGVNGFTFVQGIPDTDLSAGQEILLTDSFLNPDAIYLATIPGFSRYTMRVFSYSDQRDYYRIGPPITSFAFPDYTTTVTDNSFENFQIQMSIDYDYREVTWRGVSGTSNIFWSVIADKNNSLGVDLNIPGQITNLHPELRTRELVNNAVKFYRSNGTFTYDDFLALAFKRQQKLEYEQYILLSK